jgi:hypothetical protein
MKENLTAEVTEVKVSSRHPVSFLNVSDVNHLKHEVHVNNKNSVSVSQKTHLFSVTKTSWLDLLTEIIRITIRNP